jgi:TRAP-type C4-dicarboxylate transport system permease small subunit
MDDDLVGRLNRLNGRATRWLARGAAFILAAVAAITFCDVLGRYVFNSPFTFTVEFTELSMALIVYFGVGLTTHDRGHIVVDVVTLRMPEAMRALSLLVTNVLSFAFLVIMIWRLWQRAAFLLEKGDTTPIWLIPLWPVAFLMAAGSLFLLTGIFLQSVEAFKRVTHRRQPLSPPPVPRPFSD